MAKRRANSRKDSSIVAVAMKVDWWFSAVVSSGIFAFTFFILPAIALQNMFVRALAGAFKPILIMSGGFFALIAVFNYFRQTKSVTSFSAQCVSLDSRSTPHASSTSEHKVIHGWSKNDTQWGYSGFQSDPIGADKTKHPTSWSIELLRVLEWKRFEMLCAEYFRVLGKRVETISHGADGGVDARIYANNSNNLEYAIQCKAWGSMVGIKPVRELFGVMHMNLQGRASSWQQADSLRMQRNSQQSIAISCFS